MDSTAGSASDPVLDLEALRQQVEAAEHRIAGKAEFLEQYGGSPAERLQALQSMARDRERRDALEARLCELVASLRQHDGDAVHRWADRHRHMLARVVAERDESIDGAARRAAAERTMRDWDEVEAGQGRCVCLNRHLLADCVREAGCWLRGKA
jgi:hypothetical protein